VALVRVYVCTYRRNHLLPRALGSLLSQTFQDWTCELHNDDPADDFPERLVASIGDPRIAVVNHPRNLGTTATFNLVFRPVSERYVTMLEDDNWWQPEFLEVMVRALDARPSAHVAWANMRVWFEEKDGSWRDSGRNLWQDTDVRAPLELHYFPDLTRMGTARHSNGAMLVRTERLSEFLIPDSVPPSALEATRERTFPHPLLFVSQPLANFAITQRTTRSEGYAAWSVGQVMLKGTFMRYVPLTDAEVAKVWESARHGKNRSTNDLLLACLFFAGCRRHLRFATPGDMLRLALSVARHPKRTWQTLTELRSAVEMRSFLEESTERRVRAALEQGFNSFDLTSGQPMFRNLERPPETWSTNALSVEDARFASSDELSFTAKVMATDVGDANRLSGARS